MRFSRRWRYGRKLGSRSFGNLEKIRFMVIRDGDKCWVCGLPVMGSVEPETERLPKYLRGVAPSVDHVIPRSEGGTYGEGTSWLASCKLAHRFCNAARHNHASTLGPRESRRFCVRILLPLAHHHVVRPDEAGWWNRHFDELWAKVQAGKWPTIAPSKPEYARRDAA